MKKTFIYIVCSAIFAAVITHCTDTVVWFGIAWANLFISIGALAFKLDK